MKEFRTRLTANGRILIPAACRNYLHLKIGEELILRITDSELRVMSLTHSLKKAQTLVKQHAKNKSLVNQLQVLRKQDIKDE